MIHWLRKPLEYRPRKTGLVIICSPNGILKDVTSDLCSEETKNEYEEAHIQQAGKILTPRPMSGTTERTASLIFIYSIYI